MISFFHRLLNPHCPDCQLAITESKVCTSCETLKMQLSIANAERNQMLNTILSFTKPAEQQAPVAVDYEALKPKVVTWAVRKQMLEAEDRKQAQVLAEQAKMRVEEKKFGEEKNKIAESISKLEKEVGIEEVTNGK